ncbi:phosphatidylserine/phosphatidylglycerophosphate/cardiolipin synthase-like enzyme [Rhodoligotrophos appendicifer]|uniref:phospholipase D-like domain-containing protein n=1 Tax=Rhodoligotrophos appendicifer TaxID=987056 RepID=UPI001FE832FD|nr:phospholipase D-like domain-containing protein [Rhodoligotrophos appendicifer]
MTDSHVVEMTEAIPVELSVSVGVSVGNAMKLEPEMRHDPAVIGTNAVDLPSGLVKAAGAGAVLSPGRNCREIVRANNAALLVDAQNYFAEVEKALQQAQRSILIVGWDFDARIRLRPDVEGSESLGTLLRRLVEERPELEVRVLVWSVAVAHAPGATFALLFGADWEDHPRIQVRLDTEHPVYAAHHQKLVCIDDVIAFAGGIDLTVGRWDTSAHTPKDPWRLTPDGAPYGPVHDLQMAVDGEAAVAIARVARERWLRALGEDLPAIEPCPPIWPDDLQADFQDIAIGVSLTVPATNFSPAVAQVAALTINVLAAAQRSIYIEAQYFTCSLIRKVLASHLARSDGPEIIAIVSRAAEGVVEKRVMGENRDRLIRRLKRHDPYDRLKVLYPVATCDGETAEVLIHAKLMIIDDDVIRVGSANLNNRSMGLDTELDLTIEANGDERIRSTISRIRNDLLGEHLGCDGQLVAKVIAESGSMVAALEQLQDGPRSLHPFPALTEARGPVHPTLWTAVLDPMRPIRLFNFFRKIIPRRRQARARRR